MVSTKEMMKGETVFVECIMKGTRGAYREDGSL